MRVFESCENVLVCDVLFYASAVDCGNSMLSGLVRRYIQALWLVRLLFMGIFTALFDCDTL